MEGHAGARQVANNLVDGNNLLRRAAYGRGIFTVIGEAHAGFGGAWMVRGYLTAGIPLQGL